MSSDEKVVQTELPPEEYELLRRVAEDEAMSIKETVREAVTEYAEAKARPDPDDPFFSYEPEGSVDEPVDATETETYLYGEE